MIHEDIKNLISQEYDGEASPVVIDLIEKHVQECEDCFKYRESLNKMTTVLESWDDEQLSPDAETKIRKMLQDAASDKEEITMKPKNRLVRFGFGGGGVVVALLVLMVSLQVYTKRGIQGRLKSAADDIGVQYSPGNTNVVKVFETEKAGTTDKYEPYYLKTNYKVDRSKGALVGREEGLSASVVAERKPMTISSQVAAKSVDSLKTRTAGGFQVSSYVPNAPMEFWGGGYIADDEVSDRIAPYPTVDADFNTEEYDRIYENEFKTVSENPLSTFSIDVDTASYANIRRYLSHNQTPPRDSVRIEEMINYFNYDYPAPTGEHPFSITTDASYAPWNKEHKLVRIGLQGKTLSEEEMVPSNLVFLIDVSGSMSSSNKLPLLKTAYKMMVNQLTANERVAIVVYAGAAGTVLESTPGDDKQKIIAAIDQLHAGGSTAGGAGIQLAYNIAKENFIEGGNNRVILATDGDFNIGVSNTGDLTRLIEEKRKDGVFLTILGFGMGNYKDGRMEQLTNKGNGNYYYIDNEKEARKVLVDELGSTLFTIAKDVKIQIEFNPAQVKAYRLIGYENRMLAKEDFNDDTKDAGELGAGHTVTALYEVVPAGSAEEFRGVDDLKYQKVTSVESSDLMTVKLRYKRPNEGTSRLITQTINANEITIEPKGDFQFASAVAEFGLILRNSKFKANSSYEHVIEAAKNSKGADKYGYRQEFIDLVEKAKITVIQGQPGIHFKAGIVHGL